MKHLNTVILVAALCLTGCSLKPDYQKPETIKPDIIYLNSGVVEGEEMVMVSGDK